MAPDLTGRASDPFSLRMTIGKIVLTGFAPFDRWAVNSSWAGVEAFSAAAPEALKTRLHCVELPVDHAEATAAIRTLLRDVDPDICLLTGLADGGACRVERRARPPSAAPLAQTPESRDGAWPWDDALGRLDRAGLPGRLSEDAGLYVCETTYRAALDYRAETGRPEHVAFLHVPPLSDDWPPERIGRAIGAMLAPLVDGGGPIADP